MTFGEVLIRFGADITSFQAGIAKMGSEAALFGSSTIATFAMVDMAIAAAVISMGIAAVHMAGDFQQSITKLYTTAGEAKSNLQMVGDGILAMSAQVGTGAQTLVQAMYWIESGGLHGAQGLEALRVAAEAARAENANLDSVSIALAASLNAYAGKGLTAIQVMNTLTAATGQGMMTFEQLSGSLASVLPAAAKFGVSLNNVTAALATMTSQGDPAAQAATHLKQMILALEAPSKIGAASLKSVGLTSQQVADEMRVSLPGALKMITDAVGKTFPEGSAAYNQAIKNIAGGSKQMMGFLELTGIHMGTFVDNVKKISSAVREGGNNLMGWSAVQATMNFQLSSLNAAWDVLLITMGQQLLPVVTQVVQALVPIVQALMHVGVWLAHNWVAMTLLKMGLIVLAGVLAGVMLAGLIMVTVQLFVLALALAVPVGIVLGLIWVFQNWGMIAHWIQGVWAACITWLMSAFSAMGAFFVSLWGSITAWFISIWQVTIAWIMGALSAMGTWFTGLWNKVASGAQAGWNTVINGIRGIVTGAIKWLQNAWQTAVSTVVGWFNWLYNHNYYFKDLVDFIRHTVTAFVAWFENAWKTTVTNVTNVWNSLVSIATTVWTAISAAVQTVVNAVISWLTTAWNTSVTNLTALWNTISGIATAAWNAVSSAVMSVVNAVVSWLTGQWNAEVARLQAGWALLAGYATTAWNNVVAAFSAAWGKISGVLGTLLGNIKGWFTNLAAQALQWGVNLIQGFINGISSMIGNVKNAVGNIVGAVGNLIGFHSPTKEGPGRDLDKWGPALASGFARGIISGLPMVQDAMNRLMLPVSASMSGAIGNAGQAGAGGGRIENHFHVYLDSRELGSVLTPVVATRIMGAARSTGPVSSVRR